MSDSHEQERADEAKMYEPFKLGTKWQYAEVGVFVVVQELDVTKSLYLLMRNASTLEVVIVRLTPGDAPHWELMSWPVAP